MHQIEVIKGSYGKGSGTVTTDAICVPAKNTKSPNEKIKFSNVKKVELSELKSKRNLGKSAALGAVGGIALGPIGLVGGALLGGTKTLVTFEVQTKDKKKFTAKAEMKVFERILRRIK